MTKQPGDDDNERQDNAADVSWELHNLAVAAAVVDVGLSQRLGLNPADYQAMKHLMTSVEPLGTVELGNLVGLTSGSATGLVDRLERAGHLERHKDPHDRRRLILQPTSKAVQRVTDELQPLDDQLRSLFGAYTERELVAILEFLREVTAVYRSYGKDDLPDDDASGLPEE